MTLYLILFAWFDWEQSVVIALPLLGIYVVAL